jgi:hypothetical protein
MGRYRWRKKEVYTCILNDGINRVIRVLGEILLYLCDITVFCSRVFDSLDFLALGFSLLIFALSCVVTNYDVAEKIQKI